MVFLSIFSFFESKRSNSKIGKDEAATLQDLNEGFQTAADDRTIMFECCTSDIGAHAIMMMSPKNY